MDHAIAPPIDRERIAAVEALIRPHVRKTPVLEVQRISACRASSGG